MRGRDATLSAAFIFGCDARVGLVKFGKRFRMGKVCGKTEPFLELVIFLVEMCSRVVLVVRRWWRWLV